MSSPPPTAEAPSGPAEDTGPRVTSAEVRDLGQLRRTVGPDRRLAGVAGGLARHLDVDPVIVRVALVVLVLFGGAGLVVYAAGWLLVPEDGRDRAVVRLDARSRSIALTVVGGLALLALLADSVGQWGFPWPLVLVSAGALVVLLLVDRDRGLVRDRGRARERERDRDGDRGRDRDRSGVTAPPAPDRVDPATSAATPDVVPTLPPLSPLSPLPPLPPRPAPPPRRRGPVLFWFTMALALVACGGLAIAAGAGAAVPAAAYPAAVLACAGLMLVVGSVWGRAGGLVLAGLVSAVVLGLVALVGPWHGAGDLAPTPTTAAGVDGDYRLTTGEIVLDLTRVADPAGLDGRTVHLDLRAGRILVIVPDGLAVSMTGEVRWAGQVSLFDKVAAGSGGITLSDRHGAASGAPLLTVDATVGVGQVDVDTEEAG